MRYSAVCTSMLLDRVDDLWVYQEEVKPRVHNLEQVTGSLMTQQDKLNDKVNILSFDWNLNLKYCCQVVDFEAKMLSFSLNESVLVRLGPAELLGPGAVRAPSRLDCDNGRNS